MSTEPAWGLRRITGFLGGRDKKPPATVEPARAVRTPVPPRKTQLNLLAFSPPSRPPAGEAIDLELPQKYAMTLLAEMEIILAGTPPSFPWFAAEVLDAVQGPDLQISELARLINRDPVIAAQVLRLANSAFYGGLSPIVEIRDAIARLGTVEVAHIAAFASTQSLMNSSARLAYANYPEVAQNIWHHAITCSFGAAWLATQLGTIKVADVFMGSLLQDVGEIVGLQALGGAQRAGKLPRLSSDGAARLLRSIHTATGFHIATGCRYPDAIAVICRDHHAVGLKSETHLRELQVVALISALNEIIGGSCEEAIVDAGTEAALGLRLTQAYVEAIAARLRDFREKAGAIMGAVGQ